MTAQQLSKCLRYVSPEGRRKIVFKTCYFLSHVPRSTPFHLAISTKQPPAAEETTACNRFALLPNGAERLPLVFNRRAPEANVHVTAKQVQKRQMTPGTRLAAPGDGLPHCLEWGALPATVWSISARGGPKVTKPSNSWDSAPPQKSCAHLMGEGEWQLSTIVIFRRLA